MKVGIDTVVGYVELEAIVVVDVLVNSELDDSVV